MSNPNNAIGTNGAFGGRTSVNALNDVLATFTGSGVLSGWAIAPKSGMSVEVGGASGLRDVAVLQDNNGNRTTLDNISQAPVEVDIPSAPSTGSRVDAIVGYVENPPQGSATVIDNPNACGVAVVSGSASSSPSAPTESAIRTALTGEGINGTTAYIAVLGTVTVPAGTTDIDASMISDAQYTGLDVANTIPDSGISANKIDFATMRVGMSQAQTLTTKNVLYTLNFDELRYSNGESLIKGANAIRIGAGVKRVLVSGQVYWFDKINASNQSAGSMCVQYLQRNGTTLSLVNGRSTQNYFVRAFGAEVLDVEEGDVISVQVKNEHSDGSSIGANATNTWLQVMVVG